MHRHFPLGELLLGWLLSNVTIFLPLFRLAAQVFMWCVWRTCLPRPSPPSPPRPPPPVTISHHQGGPARTSTPPPSPHHPFRVRLSARFFSTDGLGHKLILDLTEVGITWSGLDVFLAAVLLVRCRLGALSRSMVSCEGGACLGADVRLAWGWWLGAAAWGAGFALNVLLDRLRLKARAAGARRRSPSRARPSRR